MSNLISRQATIDAMYAEFEYVYCFNCDHEGNEEWCEDCHRKYMKWSASRNTIERVLNGLPSVQPETAKRIVGKSRDGMTLWYQCDMCNEPVDEQDNYCRGCGRRLIDE